MIEHLGMDAKTRVTSSTTLAVATLSLLKVDYRCRLEINTIALASPSYWPLPTLMWLIVVWCHPRSVVAHGVLNNLL